MKKLVDHIEEFVCILALAVMTVLTFANVVTRYVFNFSMNLIGSFRIQAREACGQGSGGSE